MGSARAIQESKEIEQAAAQSQDLERKKRELELTLKVIDAQIASLNSEYETQKEELDKLTLEDESRNKALANSRTNIARIRKADEPK